MENNDFFKNYNEMQKQAILDFEHNLLILACAGSGKTRTITGKMAYAINQGIVSPRQICAVTFTNKAAAEMRERLSDLVPDLSSEATVRTFHSLGVLLLKRFGKYIGLDPNFDIADEYDVAQIVKDALNLNNKDGLKNAKITGSWILAAKEHGYSALDDKAQEYFYLKGINYGNDADNLSWRDIFNAYEKEKKRANALDFPDLINCAVELVENSPEARTWCHNRFKLILVDEYQDSNAMQARFLKSFASPSSHLIVVGDDDQSIYSFRGAVVDNILSFASTFNNVREIRLEKNYRSTGEILQAADCVIKNNSKRYDKEIVSATNNHGVKPFFHSSRNIFTEATYIVSELLKLKDSKETCAILYRKHKCSNVIKKVLLERHIPFKVSGGIGVLNSKIVKNAIALLKLCLNPFDTVSLKRIISASKIGLGDEAYKRLIETDPNVIVATKALMNKGRYASGFRTLNRVLLELSKQVLEEPNASGTTPPPPFSIDELPLETEETDGDFLISALNTLGINTGISEDEESLSSSSSGEGQDNPLTIYASMFDQRQKLFDKELIEDYSGGLPTQRQILQSFIYRSELGDDAGQEDDNLVTLSTMHASKGLEWDNVFICGLEEDIIPGKADSDFEIEEERRIFYVAMTRARKRLWLCSKEEASSGKFGMIALRPSSFLDEIPEDMKESIESQSEKPTAINIITPPEPNVSQSDQIQVGDRVSYSNQWQGLVLSDEYYMNRRILVVQVDSGGTIKLVDGMGQLKRLTR